ncbi:hypothetical protein [Actinoplanes awajinensis]|nr:hypothetical protein [Actinoplanes awajinensis]
MTSMFVARARTALSPEWDHGFDEAFTELVTSDPDLVRDEFDALIDASFNDPPGPPAPPAPPTGEPEPPSNPPCHRPATPAGTDPAPADAAPDRRSPP